MGRADLGVPEQRSERKDLVQRKRDLRGDLLQMAKEDICNGSGTTGSTVCRGHSSDGGETGQPDRYQYPGRRC